MAHDIGMIARTLIVLVAIPSLVGGFCLVGDGILHWNRPATSNAMSGRKQALTSWVLLAIAAYMIWFAVAWPGLP